jgi:hypothetical protein
LLGDEPENESPLKRVYLSEEKLTPYRESPTDAMVFVLASRRVRTMAFVDELRASRFENEENATKEKAERAPTMLIAISTSGRENPLCREKGFIRWCLRASK